MPPSQQNQYDFIMNPQSPRRRSFNFGHNMTARIIVVAVLLTFLVVIGLVINSFLNQDSKAQTQRLTEVAQAQSEIIRVSAIAKDKAKTTETRNFALNTRLSVESSQQQIKKSLASRGVSEKGLNKQLAASKNSKTDTTLDEAEKNNRFDETLEALLKKQLTDYQKLLQSAFSGANSSEQKALSASFENAARLVGKPAES